MKWKNMLYHGLASYNCLGFNSWKEPFNILAGHTFSRCFDSNNKPMGQYGILNPLFNYLWTTNKVPNNKNWFECVGIVLLFHLITFAMVVFANASMKLRKSSYWIRNWKTKNRKNHITIHNITIQFFSSVCLQNALVLHINIQQSQSTHSAQLVYWIFQLLLPRWWGFCVHSLSLFTAISICGFCTGSRT